MKTASKNLKLNLEELHILQSVLYQDIDKIQDLIEKEEDEGRRYGNRHQELERYIMPKIELNDKLDKLYNRLIKTC